MTYLALRVGVYAPLVYGVAQDALDALFTAEVKQIGGVELDAQGDLHLVDVELTTDHRGERRVCFRARSLVLSFDGFPLRDRNLRVTRVDLFDPEIFVLRYPDGDWDALHYFVPRRRSVRPKAERVEGERERTSGFPANGVHFHRGTVHVSFRDREGEEITWRSDEVGGRIVEDEGETLLFERFHGGFYGGRIAARAKIPMGRPFAIDLMVSITGADVEQMAKGAPFLKNPVRGTFGAVFSAAYDPQNLGPDQIIAGSATISEGDLWEFPALLGVLNVLSLEDLSDRKIHAGELLFTLRGDRIQIDRMDLQGTPVTLYGSGSVDLTGKNLEITFVPRVQSGLRGLVPVLGDLVQEILDAPMGALFPVVVRGSWGEVDSKLERGRDVPEEVRRLVERERRR